MSEIGDPKQDPFIVVGAPNFILVGFVVCNLYFPRVGNDSRFQDADFMAARGASKDNKDDDEKKKKKKRPFLTQFLSPILLKLATIGLAADENPFGVVLGGIVGQTLCTVAAVMGGKSLASQISERVVSIFGGFLFIIFGIQSFLSPVH